MPTKRVATCGAAQASSEESTVPIAAVVSLVLVLVGCVWAHVAAYRFFAARVPHSRAARRIVGVFLATMLLGPLLLRAVPRTEITGLIGRIGTLWHLFVLLAALPHGLYGLLRRVRARRDTVRPSPEGSPPSSEVAASAAAVPAADLPADPARRRALENTLAFGGAAVSASVFGYAALVARTDWEVVEVPIKLARLPKALEGFTIVQISDIHVGNLMGETTLRRGLDRVMDQRGDLIVVTGDIIDHEAKYIPLGARMFARLSARAGVFCIPGNHDHYTGASEVMEAFGRAGLVTLVNRHVVVPGSDGALVLAGVDDRWASRNRGALPGGSGPDLVKALAGSPPKAARVLLAHQPAYVDEYTERVDLQLSGHTHGGQINPVGPLLPSLIPYLRGHYRVSQVGQSGTRDGSKQLYVNRGFGTAGPPARILSRPEITKLILVSG